MAGSAKILNDDSRLSRLDRAFYRVETALAVLAGITVFSMMLMAVVSVGGRNFFNQPLPGYVDWIEQAMALIAFMAISMTQRDGGHIRMDILVGALRGRALWLVELVTTVLVLCLMLLLVWGTWAHFQRSFDFSQPMWSRDSSIDIGLPLWPAKLLAPVAFSVLAVRLVLQAIGYARALWSGTAHPVAVPLVISAAEAAAQEAAHVTGHDE